MPSLEEVLELASKYRARRVRVADIEVELHDVAFAPAPSSAKPSDLGAPDAEMCPCGHPEFEHEATGCLRGCAVTTCLREPGAPPEEP